MTAKPLTASVLRDIETIQGLSKEWNVFKFRAMSQKTILLFVAVAEFCKKYGMGNQRLADSVIAEKESSIKVRKVKEKTDFDHVDEHHTKENDSVALMLFYTSLYEEKKGNSKLARNWLLKHGGYSDDPDKRAELVAKGA